MDSSRPFSNPWTNVYGLVRSTLALGTMVPLVATPVDALFRPVERTALDAVVGHVPATRLNFFTMFGPDKFEPARWVAILALALIVSGYRPRFTGLLHWWITVSFSLMCVPAVGGDQVATVLTALLVPVSLLDSRRSHWERPPPLQDMMNIVAARVALSCLVVGRVQVAAIYLWAGVSKLNVREWSEGSAVYYWFTHPAVALPEQYHSLVIPWLAKEWVVATLTWSPILLEISLFLCLTLSPRKRLLLLPVALLFHFGNVIAFGLVSFFLHMAGALFLLLLDPTRHITLPRWARSVGLARTPHTPHQERERSNEVYS